MHRLFVAIDLAFDLGLPLIGVRLDALIGELFVNLERGVVESEFDDRKIRGCGFEVIAQAQAGQLEFRLVEIGEGVAEVNQHQIALVSDQREECGLSARSCPGKNLLHFAQH